MIAKSPLLGRKPHVSNNTGNPEWYTPRAVANAAHEVMEGIDLDPASTPVANTIIRATMYYTAADNGLIQPWYGRVWLNPPYARGIIDQFVAKLVAEMVAGNVEEAIVLTNNATDTPWWHQLGGLGAAWCLPLARFRFLNNRLQAKGKPLQGQTITYIGPNSNRFAAVFSDFGIIARPINVSPTIEVLPSNVSRET